MNDPAVIELIDIIHDEIRLFNDLLELLQEEQRAIVEDDLEGIEMSVAMQQRIAQEAHLLEARRGQAVDALSRRLDMETDSLSMGRLVQELESDEGEELGRMREALLELNQKIRTVSENNAFLIRQSVRYTERCLDILIGRPAGKGMYGKFGGRRRSADQRSLLNQTV